MSNETAPSQPTWKTTPSANIPPENKPPTPNQAGLRPQMPTLVQTIIALKKENAQLKAQLAEAQKKS